jgi:hypothetical protein
MTGLSAGLHLAITALVAFPAARTILTALPR